MKYLKGLVFSLLLAALAVLPTVYNIEILFGFKTLYHWLLWFAYPVLIIASIVQFDDIKYKEKLSENYLILGIIKWVIPINVIVFFGWSNLLVVAILYYMLMLHIRYKK